MPINMSYPKPRSLQTKIIPILRTDAATPKCVLPKGCVVVNLHVNQTTAAVTGAATFDLGWSGTAQAMLAAFSMPTTKVGLANAGAFTGLQVGVPLTADREILSTYAVGTSTAGGEGYVVIDYFMPGPGEGLYG